MIPVGKYLTARPVGIAPREVWQLCDRRGSGVGRVEWYAPWRCYVLSPDDRAVFSADCLRAIAAFCERETRTATAHDTGPRTGLRTRSEPWAEQAALIALGAEERFDVTLAAVAVAIEAARDGQRDEDAELLRRVREDVALARQQRDGARAVLASLCERTANLLAATCGENGELTADSTWQSTRQVLDRARTFLVSCVGGP